MPDAPNNNSFELSAGWVLLAVLILIGILALIFFAAPITPAPPDVSAVPIGEEEHRLLLANAQATTLKMDELPEAVLWFGHPLLPEAAADLVDERPEDLDPLCQFGARREPLKPPK